MGYRTLLIAVKGKNRSKIFEEYQVKGTSEFSEVADSDVSSCQFNGFTIFVVNDYIEPDDKLFEKLSLGATLISSYVNESVMVSYSTCWENGKEHWNILHDSQEDILHLEGHGNLPDSYETIKAKMMKLQEGDKEAAVDYIFDVPVQVFHKRVGLKYDVYDEEMRWEVLERTHNLRKKKRWGLF